MTTIRASSAREWEDLASEVYVPLQIRGLQDGFSAVLNYETVGETSLTRVRATSGEVVRAEELIDSPDTDVVMFSMQLQGTSDVTQTGATAIMAPSQSALYLADRPYRLRFHTTADVLIMRTTSTALGLGQDHLAGVAASALSVRTFPPLQLLARVMGTLLSGRPLLASSTETARVGVELLGEALSRWSGASPRVRSHEAIRASARARIAVRFADPTLTVSDLADAERVSLRMMHTVFAEVGSSPAQEIRQIRLDHARRMLEETNLPLTDIAHRSGFNDITTFTRAFRRDQGIPPGAFRSATRAR